MKAGIVLALLPLASFLQVVTEVAAHTEKTLSLSSSRSIGILQFLTEPFFTPQAHVPVFGIAICIAYALVALVVIYYFFEKTQAPEILFFALFALSLSGEFFRLIQPLSVARDWPPAFTIISGRALVFARYFGLFSLFTASIYACGIDFQKHGHVAIIIAAFALALANGIPANGQAWYSNFAPIPGYAGMMTVGEYAIAALACISFLIAAYTRGAQDFVLIALGGFLLFLGRDALIQADNWMSLITGLSLLVAGTWLFMTRVHNYYLWL